MAQVTDLLTRWQAKLAAFDAAIAAYDALPAATSDDARFVALRGAEAQISTAAEAAPNPAALRTALDAKRASFTTRRDGFAAILLRSDPGFLPLLDAVNALLPVTQWDPLPFDLQKLTTGAVAFVVDLAATVTSQRAAVTQRSAAVQAQLDVAAAAAAGPAQVDALVAAAKALLGDDAIVIPEFGLVAGQGDDWANAVAASTSGALLDWLKTTAKIDFPVEEWLTGAARVRPALRAWEGVGTLCGALGRPDPALLPIQLPFEANAPWLALQFRPDYVIASDRLLYTAHYSTPFDKTARQCGLLLDEWSEVIPATDRDTGITFNFARPDSEPPQTILVVTPATANGQWQWEDLVGALNETLDLAKKRAVEPSQLDNTPYAPLLPATTMAVTLYAISIGTSLTVANGALKNLAAAYNA